MKNLALRILEPACIIDELGRYWGENEHSFFEHCNQFSLAAAVSRFGYIFLKKHKAGVSVFLNPRNIHSAALAGLFFLLSDLEPHRVVLHVMLPQPAIEIAIGASRAIQRIEALLHYPLPSQAVLNTRRRKVEPPSVDQAVIFDELMTFWASKQLEWSDEILHENLLIKRLLSSGVVVNKLDNSDRLIINHWGKSRKLLGPWAQVSLGKDVDDQPFSNVAEWSAITHRECISRDNPVMHDVDLRIPAADGQITSRTYTRLLLPWKDSVQKGRYSTCIDFVK